MASLRCGSRQCGLLSLAFLMGTALVLWAGPGVPAANAQQVTILHTNDMHAHLLGFGPEGEYTPDGLNNDQTLGGIARIAGKVNEIRADRALDDVPTLLIDGGDFTMGTAFMFLSGAAQIGIMEALQYDAVTLGNHEFDWTPAGTADILSSISVPGVSLPVVASNTNPDPLYLQPLFDAGLIRTYFIKILDNGLKVGFFGLIGEDAVSVSPLAKPVTFGDAVLAAQAMVAALGPDGENVDLIVCISHSGIDEDSALAAAVPGIDVIISGHTHEKTIAPEIVNGTVIVQAGDHSRYVGVLDVDLSQPPASWSYNLVPIDDSVAGDAGMQALVDGFIDALDTNVLGPMGYSYWQPVAETDFDLTAKAGEERNLGNLIADAMGWMVNEHETVPVDIALESNGVIRDDILKGSCPGGVCDKNIAFSDAFRALPLGMGLDGLPGYPMLTFYMTGAEIKKALELIVFAYHDFGMSDYWLNVSGLKYTYSINGIPFFRVKEVEVGGAPLNTTSNYKIALNYYVGQFIAGIPKLINGLLGLPPDSIIGQLFAIIPKDADGKSYLDPVAHPYGLAEARVDIDPLTEGIQELKEWKGFMGYLANFVDTDSDEVPNVPDSYSGPEGRITTTEGCFVATAAYGSALEPRIEVLRSFRDEVLQTNEMGRCFVDAYYHWGKVAANWLTQHAWARAIVRVLLLPIIGFAKVLLLLAA